MSEDFRAHGATEMMLAFAPIDTGATQRAPFEFEHGNVDASRVEEFAPALRQLDLLAAPMQHAICNPTLKQRNGEAPRQMIIAGTGVAHRLVLGSVSRTQMP